jgi:hypothetical protein
MRNWELFEAKLLAACVQQEVTAFAFVWLYENPDGSAAVRTATSDMFGVSKEARDEIAGEINKAFENWLIKHKVVSE